MLRFTTTEAGVDWVLNFIFWSNTNPQLPAMKDIRTMKGTNEFLKNWSSYELTLKNNLFVKNKYHLPIQNILHYFHFDLAFSAICIVNDKSFKALPCFNFPHSNWDGTYDDDYHGVHQSQEGSEEIIIQMSHPRPLLNVQALEKPDFC